MTEFEKLTIENRIKLLESRHGAENGKIIRKLKRRLLKMAG